MNSTDSDDRLERQLARALQSEPEVWTRDCLEPERMIALVDRSVPEAEAAPLMAHVALCARCRREYAETLELLQLSQEVGALPEQATAPQVPTASTPVTSPQERVERPIAPPRPSWREVWQRWLWPGVGFGLGAAAAGIVLFATLTAPARLQREQLASALQETKNQVAQAQQANQSLSQELATLKRSQGNTAKLAKDVARLNAQNRRQGVQIARLTESEAVLQQMPLPTADWQRAGGDSVVRGVDNGTSKPEITLVRPVSVALNDTTPLLECRPAAGATDYRATLEREGVTEEEPSPQQVAATRWQVKTPLKPGWTYRWAVTAQRGDARLRSAFATFHVLSAAERQELATARQKFARSPLALGAVYARLGMVEEAAGQFQAALKTEPDNAVAKRWLHEIETRQSAPQ